VVAYLMKYSMTEKKLVFKDEVFGPTTAVSHMLFVTKGLMTLDLAMHGTAVLEVLKAHSWACELVLWSQRCRMDRPFVAEQFTVIVQLDPNDFRHCVIKFGRIKNARTQEGSSHHLPQPLQGGRYGRQEGLQQGQARRPRASSQEHLRHQAPDFPEVP